MLHCNCQYVPFFLPIIHYSPRHRRSESKTPDCDQPKKLLLSSSGKEGDTSAPCLFTFLTRQKRSECEDYSTLPEWNSMKALR